MGINTSILAHLIRPALGIMLVPGDPPGELIYTSRLGTLFHIFKIFLLFYFLSIFHIISIQIKRMF